MRTSSSHSGGATRRGELQGRPGAEFGQVVLATVLGWVVGPWRLGWARAVRSRSVAGGLMFALALAACGGGRAVAAPTDAPLRVLVTGFNDWRDLGEPPNVWRCRDNPSCRLLIGEPQRERPTGFGGPLVERLHQQDPTSAIEWTFVTLPVTWEVAKQLPDYAAHDIVVHIGLGVYDRTDVAYVEGGAFNRRRGTDARGRVLDEPISSALGGNELRPVSDGTIARQVRSVDGQRFGPLEVRAMRARDANAYLCNETHFWALQAVERSRALGGRLDQAYFIHIPFPLDGDYEALAEGVAGLVLALVGAPIVSSRGD